MLACHLYADLYDTMLVTVECVLAEIDRRMAEFVRVSGPPKLPPFTGNKARMITGNTAAPQNPLLAEAAAPRVTRKPAPSSAKQKTGAAGLPKAASASAKSAPAGAAAKAWAASAAAEPADASAVADQLATASVSDSTPASAAAAPAIASTPAASATAPTTTSLPQFADDDPDSPYCIIDEATTDALLHMLEQVMVRDLMAQQWDTYFVHIPPAPKTAKAAAKLQGQTDQLLAEGLTFEACPWQCQIAMYSICRLGPEHPDTLRAVFAVTMAMAGRSQQIMAMCAWLLPRAAKAWGLGHPHTRYLAVFGARVLGMSPDPRIHPPFTQAVTNVCRLLPGGLGWGTAVVAPVPNEREYERWCFVLLTARDNMETSPLLAKELLQRCIKYFVSLGPHWLGSQRLPFARKLLAECVVKLDGPAAAAAIRLETKRAAQKELGAEHDVALEAVWEVRGCTTHTHTRSRPTHTCPTHTHTHTHFRRLGSRMGGAYQAYYAHNSTCLPIQSKPTVYVFVSCPRSMLALIAIVSVQHLMWHTSLGVHLCVCVCVCVCVCAVRRGPVRVRADRSCDEFVQQDTAAKARNTRADPCGLLRFTGKAHPHQARAHIVLKCESQHVSLYRHTRQGQTHSSVGTLGAGTPALPIHLTLYMFSTCAVIGMHCSCT